MQVVLGKLQLVLIYNIKPYLCQGFKWLKLLAQATGQTQQFVRFWRRGTSDCGDQAGLRIQRVG